MNGLTLGALLIVVYTGMMAGADGITKMIAGQFEAPQLFAVSALLVLGLALLMTLLRRQDGGVHGLRTRFPRVMALRSGLTVLAAIGFFQAFRHLPFADVFLFIGLIPVLAAAFSGPILGEHPRPTAWIAVTIGAAGILFLMPGGPSSVQLGHLWALLAAVTGTLSMLLGRYIARAERVPLAQVFWPNLALLVTMGLALPFVWQPMTGADLIWVAFYSVLLFAGRYVVAEAFRLLPAYVATPLMNLQFAWMVVIGYVGFAEMPGLATLLGVALVIGSGLWLVADEALPRRSRIVPAE
ncbi:DMT family transporter [Thalassococcus sp. CAU 1522]|uniref:DMT family transporter n=1 Tax=Thalassococcus arenae TaxID=2851652 RepID=A0ABS6N9P5_9RHOB|nr:DMT family transporter [Thalassococcus arenae]MBV2360743.1 DMT family transporter [Thalassococcus arenae]